MPALIDIRRRIRSVKSTQQITKAMKMVSAAKLRRAQEAMFAARPYARKMLEVLNDVAARASADAHPLLEARGHDKLLLVVITGDKGLCGAFNANIIRTAARFVEDRRGQGVELAVVGRKARDAMRRRGYKVRTERVGAFQPLRYATARELAKELIEAFTSGAADEVYLVYNEFKSVIQQRIVVDRLLPIERQVLAPQQQAAVDYIYEPEPAGIFKSLLPRHVEVQVWKALLESQAAEHGARMTSMDAATNNAAEMIDGLTLYMNKVRQAAITKEIIEIVSGAGTPA
jgi:F-type H+-transporting ATPase subunit gamma